MLAVVATDATFQPAVLDGAPVWVGKCIHCSKKLVVAADGTPLGAATIEHIWPRHHGGSDDVDNLALACAGCNIEKGRRHDRRRRDDRLAHVAGVDCASLGKPDAGRRRPAAHAR